MSLFFLLLISIAGLLLLADSGERRTEPRSDRKLTRPIAILGDSDSHSYHDRETFPPGSFERGGKYRATTFNWPEVLDRLRSEQVDLGEWRVWGPYRPIAKAREILGLPARRPRKEDFRYNFAINGAGCHDLNAGWRQVDRLIATMKLEPDRWKRGIVIIRIGVNSFGRTEQLAELAKNPNATSPSTAIAECVDALRIALDRIRSEQPLVRFVLVGIFDNAHWARNLDKWRDPTELSNISLALDHFDNALRDLASITTSTAFFDDRAWFEHHFGARDAAGYPAYREWRLPNGGVLTNTVGDSPSNATLADGHTGTAWNAMWAQALVSLVSERLDPSVRPISDAEVARFLDLLPAS